MTILNFSIPSIDESYKSEYKKFLSNLLDKKNFNISYTGYSNLDCLNNVETIRLSDYMFDNTISPYKYGTYLQRGCLITRETLLERFVEEGIKKLDETLIILEIDR